MAKVLLSLCDDLLKDIDRYCLQFKYERSELIRQAIRDKIYPKDISQPQPLKEETKKDISNGYTKPEKELEEEEEEAPNLGTCEYGKPYYNVSCKNPRS